MPDASKQTGGSLSLGGYMYVVAEYLVSLAIVTVIGLVLFGAAVVGLVAKAGAARVAAEAAEKLPRIAAHLSPRQLPDLKKNHQSSLAGS
jgi:hypothetical protein